MAKSLRRLRWMLFTFLIVSISSIGALQALAQESTPSGSPEAITSFTVSGLIDSPATLTVADLATFAAESVDVTFTAGGNPRDVSFTGTNLYAFLESFGLQIPDEPHNAMLGMVAKLTASDGYVTVISLGEIDPGFGAAPMLLAWEEDGEPLTLPRLVVPGDIRGGRYVSDVISIEILLV